MIDLLAPRKQTQPWYAHHITYAAQEWERKYGQPPKAENWRYASPGRPTTQTVQRVFGAWAEMLVAAGFERPRVGQRTHWTRDRVIDALQNYYVEHWKSPGWRDAMHAGPLMPHWQTVVNLFGSWSEALRVSGLPPAQRYRRRWSKDEIAALMLDWLLVRGTWPTCRDWTGPQARELGVPSAGTVKREFGSWNAAREYAGWDGSFSRRGPVLRDAGAVGAARVPSANGGTHDIHNRTEEAAA